ncbi:Iq domain-containing protein e-like [Plakobranchus ocellatus]|uniref:Iq domain-containing protein e-like n=1 Tax=Plakobranchus ocellatus TaxID=259542 RepID=A0AAV4DTT5_9GAST|nr:Iq domain-containing protein e-like [Plakobranchus ocellatus]
MADADKLISRNRSPTKMQQNVSRKSNKKTPRRPVTPGKAKAKTGRDHWMAALKKRQALTMSNVYRSASPRHKTPTEYFVDTLRKTGVGLSSETNKSQSMTGLNRAGGDGLFPYRSTSHYMRQVMGIERASPIDDPTVRPNVGTPNYKSPEEYYDEVLGLRKQLAALSHENATQKTKIRRVEEDNLKKEREIEGLLNPTKNGELRRTLGDRQADSGAVVHSLKQKILKLEMQLREKESAYCKLQADLKTTKIDETRVQMEALYAEILRLQLSRDTGVDKSRKESAPKVKALNETVIRLSKTNEQLQAENRALQDDLHRALEESDSKLDIKQDHADKNRRELLATISQLERRLEQGGSRYDSEVASVLSQDGLRKPQSKIELQGSVEDRLHQLDQRETELLDEVEKLRAVVRRSRDEKRRTGDDSSSLPPTPRRRQSRAATDDGLSSRPTSGRRASRAVEDGIRPPSSRSRDSVENFKQKHAATSIQRQWRQRRQRQTEDEVEAFRENRAARKIQHGWIDYKHRRYDHELDDAAGTIQAVLKGHHTRRHKMANWQQRRSSSYSPTNSYYDTPSSDTEEGVYLIQSSLRGHKVRQQQLRNWRNQYADDDEDSVLSGSYGRRRTSPNLRPSSGYSRPMSGDRPLSSGSRRQSSAGRRTPVDQRPGSSHRPSSASMMSKRGSVSQTFKASYDVPSPSQLNRDSDDDDIMF